jgi:hypothetical protein
MDSRLRRCKRLALWLIAVIAVLAVTGAVVWRWWISPYQQLSQNAHKIDLALMHYAADNSSYYPQNIEILLNAGYLKNCPANPFAPGSMQPLAPDAAPVPGCFVYFAEGPLFRDPAGSFISPKAAAAAGRNNPDGYSLGILIYYGNSWCRLFHVKPHFIQKENTAYSQIHWNSVAIENWGEFCIKYPID